MKTFIIQGNHLINLDDFYDEIEKLFLKNSDLKFWRNLDAFNDILYWWFGSFNEEENIMIIWKDFKKSQIHIKEINIIEEIFLGHKNIKFIKA